MVTPPLGSEEWRSSRLPFIEGSPGQVPNNLRTTSSRKVSVIPWSRLGALLRLFSYIKQVKTFQIFKILQSFYYTKIFDFVSTQIEVAPLRRSQTAEGLLNTEGNTQLKRHSAQHQVTKSYTFPPPAPPKKENLQSRHPSREVHTLVSARSRFCHSPETSQRSDKTKPDQHRFILLLRLFFLLLFLTSFRWTTFIFIVFISILILLLLLAWGFAKVAAPMLQCISQGRWFGT
ncbi:hypothetical protein J1605_016743 [Eschrichtius robustus]|uniref:Uncharacterized protein n=1 Tax=Eschrichtius robustus TaxID=9764 RepID=A0AB34I4G7_ESCRO|nr:hypothetical protein J1605_016743 [Eschrichtius robustus]